MHPSPVRMPPQYRVNSNTGELDLEDHCENDSPDTQAATNTPNLSHSDIEAHVETPNQLESESEHDHSHDASSVPTKDTHQPVTEVTTEPNNETEVPALRRSTRVRRPPTWLLSYVQNW